jgi:hypothetical protein
VGLLRRTICGAALVTGAVLASGVQAASAMPPNDVRSSASKIFIRDANMTGVRLKAERTNHTGLIDPEFPFLTGTPDDSGDPPLTKPLPSADELQPASTCWPRASVTADPSNATWYATRTVWYEITPDDTGAPFNQSVLVTVDSAGSSFASALQVFEGSGPPGKFVPGTSLPTNNIACDMVTNVSQGLVPAVVSFVAKRGLRYFVEAGVAPTGSAGSTLRIAMRYLDVTAPSVTVRSDSAALDASEVFAYNVSTTDGLAKQRGVAVQQIHGTPKPGDALSKLKVRAEDCNDRKILGHPGFWCQDKGGNIFVRWRPVRAPGDSGRVTASYADPAGNIGVNSLTLSVRDRKPPVISGSPRVRWSRKGRLFVATRCTGGPGSIRVEVTTGGKPARAGADKVFRTRKTMILKQAYKKVRRKTLFVHITCFDQSKNSTDRWLFLPR